MLVYVVTVATSAFFVPHYLSIFWEPLKTNPWDIVGGAIVIVVLVTLNVVGVQEAARLSIVLAVIDFATQVLLVLLGFFLVFSPTILVDNVHWGVAPTWSNFAIAIPVAMLAYTGRGDRLEPRRGGARAGAERPERVQARRGRGLRDLPDAAARGAVGDAREGDRRPADDAARAAAGAGRLRERPDPRARREPRRRRAAARRVLEIYVGVLAATILFIATNAGVIGASRITYSMASYRQIPEVFRRLHPTLQDAGALARPLRRDRADPDHPARRRELRRHALLVRRHALVHRRPCLARPAAGEAEGLDGRLLPGRPNLHVGGVEWPLFAIVGGIATGASFLVIVVQNPPTRWVGLGWIASGSSFYVVYRRRFVHASLTETSRRRRRSGPPSRSSTGGSRPVVAGQPSDDALDVACSLAAERGARIVALNVLEVPLDRPLDADLDELEDAANGELDEAIAIGDSYGVRVLDRLVRARSAGPAIVEEAERRGTEIIVIGTPRKTLTRRQRARVRQYRRLRPPPCALPRPRHGVARGGAGMIWYRRCDLRLLRALRRDRPGAARRHRDQRRRPRRLRPRRALRRARASAGSSWSANVARKLRGFERVLDAPALFAVAYDEIGSSIYFALGIVAGAALGLTPLVLLATGLLFLARLALLRRGHGRDPRDRRRRDVHAARVQRPRRVRDGLGAPPRLPHRHRALDALPAALPRGGARGRRRCARARGTSSSPSPSIAADHRRAARPAHAHPPRPRSSLALLDLAVQLLVVVLGFAFVFSPHVLTNGFDLAPGQGWHDLLFALPLAMLAYTGLETVANLAEETREPGRDAAAVALLLDRPRRDHDGADRGRRRVRVPGRDG